MLDLNRAKAVSSMARKVQDFVQTKADPNLHGGCYVDTMSGIVHINLVEGRENALRLEPTEGVIYETVKYSLADLDAAREKIASKNNCPDWFAGSGIDTTTNKIRLYVLKDKLSRQSFSMNAVAGEGMFYVNLVDERMKVQPDTIQSVSDISEAEIAGRAASQWTYNGQGWNPHGYGGGSIAAGLQFYSAGQYRLGWIGTTHGDALGVDAYYVGNGGYTKMGYIHYVNFSDQCDFCIVQRTNTNLGARDHTTSGVVTNLQGGWPGIGDVVFQAGRTSGTSSGICTENYWNGPLGEGSNPTYKYNFIATNIGMWGGDSGGPLLWRQPDGRWSLVGIQSAGSWNAPGGGMSVSGKLDVARRAFHFDLCAFS